MTTFRTRRINIIRTCLTGALWSVLVPGLEAQTLFHQVHEYGGWPGTTERALRLSSGSFILFSGGQYPQCGGLSKLGPDGIMQWNKRVEFPLSGGGGAIITTAFLDPEQKIILAITGAYPSDGALVRMDTNGTVLWTRQIGHPLADVILTDDGNYAAFGGAAIAAEGSDWDIYFYKVGYDGTVLTSTHYVNSNPFINYNNLDKYGYELVQDASSSYFLAFMYGTRTCIMKLDPAGQFQWMKVIWEDDNAPFFGSSVHAWRLFLRSDGDLLLCGKQASPPDPRILVSIHVNSSGQVLGSTIYENALGVDALDALMAPDSSIYFWTALQPAGNAVVRIGQDRTLLDAWQIIHSPARIATGLSVDADGGFDLFTLVPDTSLSSAPLDMERVNGTFTTECDSTDHPLFTESPITVAVIDSFPLMTFTAPYPDTTSMILTTRIPDTKEACLPNTTPVVDVMQIPFAFPNPTNDLLHFDQRVPIAQLRLANSIGVIVRTCGISSAALSMEDLPPGIYYLQVWTRQGPMRCMRIVKE